MGNFGGERKATKNQRRTFQHCPWSYHDAGTFNHYHQHHHRNDNIEGKTNKKTKTSKVEHLVKGVLFSAYLYIHANHCLVD